MNNDPRMKLVNKFNQIHLKTNSYSIFKEADRYCSEQQLRLTCEPDSLIISFPDEDISTQDEMCCDKLSRKLKLLKSNHYLQSVLSYKWQGVILKSMI